MTVDDRVFIVTGAGSGIGAALAEQLSSQGAHVVLAGRRIEKLRAVAARCTGASLVVPTDITQHDQLVRLVNRAHREYGRIDGVINNAGMGFGGDLTELTPEEIEYNLAVNLIAPIWLCRLSLPHLRERDEAIIVNVGSLSGLFGVPSQAVYCGSKFGLRGFSEALRRDLAGSGIRVLSVHPAAVDTELNTAEMRARCAEIGPKIVALSADAAAAQIVAGIRNTRRELVVGSFADRMVVRLSRWFPGLMDRLFAKARPSLELFSRMANARQRERRAA